MSCLLHRRPYCCACSSVLLTTVVCEHKRPQHCKKLIGSNHTRVLCIICMRSCGLHEVLLHDMLLQHLGQGLLDDCVWTTTRPPPCKRAAHARWTLRRVQLGLETRSGNCPKLRFDRVAWHWRTNLKFSSKALLKRANVTWKQLTKAVATESQPWSVRSLRLPGWTCRGHCLWQAY